MIRSNCKVAFIHLLNWDLFILTNSGDSSKDMWFMTSSCKFFEFKELNIVQSGNRKKL
jgi:hypothetical protein